MVQNFNSIFTDCTSLRCDIFNHATFFNMRMSARSLVSFQIIPQQVSISKYMRHTCPSCLKKNKYCHCFKWQLCYAMSGESNVKTVVYGCVTRSLMSALCTSRLGCPTYLNPAVTKKKRTQNNCSPVKSVSKLSTVTGSHGLQSEEQAKSYLVVTQLFSPTCVLLTERQNPCTCLLWLTLREIGNDSPVRQVRLEVFAYGCMLCFERLNTNWSLEPHGIQLHRSQHMHLA